jgi:hypothetical protein
VVDRDASERYMARMRAWTVALAIALSLGCGSESSGSSSSGSHASARAEAEEFVGGIGWHVIPPLAPHAPSSAMRAAEYVLTDHPDTTLAVFHFGEGQGGSVDDNINRWVDQFTQPDGRSSRDVAQITRREVAGLPVTLVDVSGAFSGMRGSEQTVSARDQRMLGAIVEGPEGLVFFKLTGPADEVETAAHSFEETIASIHPTR